MIKSIPDKYLGSINRVLDRGNYITSYFGDMKLTYIGIGNDAETDEEYMVLQINYKDLYHCAIHFKFLSNDSDNLDKLVMDGCHNIFTHAASKAINSNRFKFKTKQAKDELHF